MAKKVVDSDACKGVASKVRDRIKKKFKLKDRFSIMDSLPILVLSFFVLASLYLFPGLDFSGITGASITTVGTCGFETNQSNSTLNISGNLSIGANNPCILVQHDNVTVQCNGFSIIGTGDGDSARGIRANGSSAFRVLDCNIINFGDGRAIQVLNGSNSSEIRNVTFENNQYGVEVWASDNLDIFNLTLTGNTFLNNDFGIRFLGEARNENHTVNNTTFIRNNVSILIEDPLTRNITVNNNTFNHSNETGILLDDEANNVTILMNFFDSDGPATTADGVGSIGLLNNSDDILISTNNLSNSERPGADFGIRVQESSSNISIYNNFFFNHTLGIKIENGGGVENITVDNNTFDMIGANIIEADDLANSLITSNNFVNPGLVNHSSFIVISTGNHSFISNNVMSNVRSRANGFAITSLNNSSITNNTLSGVTVTTEIYGISLSNSGTTSVATGTNVSGNIFNVNYTIGIRLVDQNHTIVGDNQLYNLSKEAISVQRTTVAAGNVSIQNNTIIGAKAGIHLAARTRFNTITGNTINETRTGINVTGSINSLSSHPFRNVLHNNQILDANFSSIALIAANETSVIDNVISSPVKPHSIYVNLPGLFFAGIFEFQGLNNSYRNNSINYTYHGIYLDRSNNTTIDANFFGTHSGTGISLVSSNYLNVSGNTEQDSNGTGIFLFDTNLSNINNNTLRSNVNDGIHLVKSFSNNLTNNTAISNNNGIQIDFFSGFNRVFNCANFATNANADLLLDFFSTNTSSDCGALTVTTEDNAENNTIV